MQALPVQIDGAFPAAAATSNPTHLHWNRRIQFIGGIDIVARKNKQVVFRRISPAKEKESLGFPEQPVDNAVVTEFEMQNTLQLVECAMLAATAGLSYFLSNLLRFESYFGFFFPLPIVISALRWGAAAGRKTMVTTFLLLTVIAGPLKATSYMLMHGLLGVAIGAFWRWKINWGLSIIACTLVRAVGSVGFVFLSSWLIRENILNLITINTHATMSHMVAAAGINVTLTMPMIYTLFTFLLLVNCASFVFLLHVIYAIILQGLGISSSVAVPGWVKRAI